jgi:Fe-S-cluster containining protein
MEEDDLQRASAYLEMKVDDFVEEFCRDTVGITFLKDQDDDLKSCIFLFEDEKGLAGCHIHGAKPAQCAAFPFQWRPRNVLGYCDGMRALEGLPPTSKAGKRTIDDSDS